MMKRNVLTDDELVIGRDCLKTSKIHVYTYAMNIPPGFKVLNNVLLSYWVIIYK